MENMTRGPGWHFLSIGRRLERSVHLVKLFRTIIVPLNPQTWPALEMLLEVTDSSMAYRSRYFTILQPAPVLDLLMNEEANPRSLAFQAKDLSEHCRSLSSMPSGRRMAGCKTKTSGGRRVRPVSRGCAHALRAGCRGLSASELDETSRRNGRGFAGIVECHYARLLQSRANRSGPHDLSRAAQNHL